MALELEVQFPGVRLGPFPFRIPVFENGHLGPDTAIKDAVVREGKRWGIDITDGKPMTFKTSQGHVYRGDGFYSFELVWEGMWILYQDWRGLEDGSVLKAVRAVNVSAGTMREALQKDQQEKSHDNFTSLLKTMKCGSESLLRLKGGK